MTFGDLPPSSSETRLRSLAAALTISLPTSVEPVKAILLTPGWPARRARGLAEARDDVDDAVRQAGFEQQFAEPQGGKRGLLGYLENDGAARGEGGASFQAAIGSGKFQRMIWTTTPIGSGHVTEKKSAPRRLYGEIDIRSMTLGAPGDDLAGRRVAHLEGLAGFGGNPFAVDQRITVLREPRAEFGWNRRAAAETSVRMFMAVSSRICEFDLPVR